MVSDTLRTSMRCDRRSDGAGVAVGVGPMPFRFGVVPLGADGGNGGGDAVTDAGVGWPPTGVAAASVGTD